MGFLADLFRTKRAPPVPPPTYDEAMRDIIGRDSVLMWPQMNAAPGTYGAVIMDAVKLGYLRKVRSSQFEPENGGWSAAEYEPTQLGRNRYP